jgi:hypothetical protein
MGIAPPETFQHGHDIILLLSCKRSSCHGSGQLNSPVAVKKIDIVRVLICP